MARICYYNRFSGSSFTDKKPLKRLRLSQAVVNTQLKQGVNERVSQRPNTIPLLDLIDFAAKPHILWHRPTERPIHLSLDA